MWRIFEYLGLALALALIVAGTALMWDNRANLLPNDHRETKDQYNWDGATFWVAWAFACAAVFFRSTMLAVLAAGMTVGFSLFLYNNLFSFTQINKCRRLDYEDSSFATRRCAAGGILAYAGIGLALVVAFSPYSWLAAPSIVPKMISLMAVLVLIPGLVCIWAAQSADVTNPAYVQTLDATVMAMLATFYTLAGTFGFNVPLRAAAGFLSAFAFVWIFHNMFDAHLNVGGHDPQAQVYAGFILSWIAMLLNMTVSVLLFYGQAFATSRAPTNNNQGTTGTGTGTGTHSHPTGTTATV